MHDLEPWKLAKNNRAFFEECIAVACNALRVVGLVLWPVMPTKMEELLASIGVSIQWGFNYDEQLRHDAWEHVFTVVKTDKILFTRPESHLEEIAPAEPKVVEGRSPQGEQERISADEIGIEDVVKVHLVAGTITDCKPVPNSDKLLCLQVDAGEYGKRQILSGVAKDLKPEELVGRQGIFIANLKPRKMAGIMSEGMMLYAYDAEGKNKLATVDGAANGKRVQ